MKNSYEHLGNDNHNSGVIFKNLNLIVFTYLEIPA